MTTQLGDSGALQWQSRWLVIVVTPLCAAAAGTYLAGAWTEGARTVLLISLGLAVAVWLLRAATPLAALTGGVLTAAMALMRVRPGDVRWSHSALPPLFALFLLTFAATRFGRRRKEQLGIAERRHGRNAAQVVANLGIAGLAGALPLAILFFRDPALTNATPGFEGAFRSLSGGTLCATMLVAALAEATADTLSSELGEVLGGEPFLITTRRRIAPGTDGGVTIAGTLAGGAGALAIVVVALPAMGLDRRAAAAAGAGAIGGLFFDSLLGATAERRGWLNNDAVNFLSTLAAAALAALLSMR